MTGPERAPSRAEICVVACAEAWRGDGAILASPMGLIPTLGARLAQATFAPELLVTDGEAGYGSRQVRPNRAKRTFAPATGLPLGSTTRPLTVAKSSSLVLDFAAWFACLAMVG